MGQHLVMPSIRSRDIACVERSGVRHREDALQLLDFADDMFDVHSLISIANLFAAQCLKPASYSGHAETQER